MVITIAIRRYCVVRLILVLTTRDERDIEFSLLEKIGVIHDLR